MATVELTADNLNSTVTDGRPGPGRLLGRVVRAVPDVRAGLREGLGTHPDAVFGKVDTEAEPEVAATFNITSIPTLMIIRDNIVLYAQPGALPEAALEELITKASELDMDEVRASMTPVPAGAQERADADQQPRLAESSTRRRKLRRPMARNTAANPATTG